MDTLQYLTFMICYKNEKDSYMNMAIFNAAGKLEEIVKYNLDFLERDCIRKFNKNLMDEQNLKNIILRIFECFGLMELINEEVYLYEGESKILKMKFVREKKYD